MEVFIGKSIIPSGNHGMNDGISVEHECKCPVFFPKVSGYLSDWQVALWEKYDFMQLGVTCYFCSPPRDGVLSHVSSI